MTSTQQWFEQWLAENYPTQKEKEELTTINTSGAIWINSKDNADYRLTIEGFPQLKKLQCSNNKLTDLSIINCPQVSHIDCQGNQLSSLKFLNKIDPKKLIFLNFKSNKIKGDLNVLQKFVELEKLWMSNNLITGSLKYLKDFTGLKSIYFKNTSVDSDIEFLSDGTEEIEVNDKLEERLRTYREKNFDRYFSLKWWKRMRVDLIEEIIEENQKLKEKIEKLEVDVNVAIDALGVAEKWDARKELIEKNKKLEEEIKRLKNQLATGVEVLPK